MKRTILLAALTVAAWGDPLSEARAAIQGRYEQMNRAYEQKDLEGSTGFCSPDFVFISAEGNRYPLKDLRKSNERVFERCSKIHASSKIVKIRLDGPKKATVQVEEHFEKLIPGFLPGTKTPSKSKDTAQDTWILTPKGWFLTNSTNLTEQFAYSGKKKQGKAGPLRVVREKGRPVALETQIARYSKGNKTVDLVSALHVGEHAYYQQLNQEFKNYDGVLYELIAPDDAVPEANQRSDNALSDSQMLLTNMLGLKFQLNEIDYHARNFVHADLTPEQLFASMDKRGESAKQMIMQILRESMATSTDIDPQDAVALNVALPRIMVNGARASDHALLRRVFAISFQKMDKITAALSGPKGSTLIDVRNQQAVAVMQKQFQRGRKRLAIFFGAGHMPNLEARLKNLGYRLQSVRYLKAWDLRNP